MNRGHLSLTSRPGPVRKDMGHRKRRSPPCLIKPETVFRETGKIEDSEVGTSRRERHGGDLLSPWFKLGNSLGLFLLRVEVGQNRRVEIIRSRLSEIVITRPYEFSGALGILILIEPLVIRRWSPGGSIKVIGTYLERSIHRPSFALLIWYRELIISPCTDAGGRFAAKIRLSRVGLMEGGIWMGLIIESIHIDALVIGLGRWPEIVIAAGCRPCRVLLMTNIS